MDVTEALDACTLAELDMIRTVYYSSNYAERGQGELWEHLISRQVILTRNELCDKYNITRDDFGHYTTIGEPYKLMMDQLRCAAQAMLAEADSPYHVSDDGLDYLSAATDQAAMVTELLTNDDGLDTYTDLLYALNLTEDDAQDDAKFTYIQCLRYGYADHGSPMSDLAFMNNDAEGNDPS